MFFTAINTSEEDTKEKIKEIKKIAYGRVYYYRIHTAEIALSQYLLDHVKMDLKTACKHLILQKVCINTDSTNDTFIITFKDAESNKLAELITYGNSEVAGSHILRFAFKQNY